MSGWSRKTVKSLFGAGALVALALTLPPSAEATDFWCDQGVLYMLDDFGDLYWGTSYTEGNMTVSCVGDRVRTVLRIE